MSFLWLLLVWLRSPLFLFFSASSARRLDLMFPCFLQAAPAGSSFRVFVKTCTCFWPSKPQASGSRSPLLLSPPPLPSPTNRRTLLCRGFVLLGSFVLTADGH